MRSVSLNTARRVRSNASMLGVPDFFPLEVLLFDVIICRVSW